MDNLSNNTVDHFLVKKNRGDVWRTLIHSEWFVIQLVSYIWIRDVVELDSAICNHEDRRLWLERLSKTTSFLHANLKPINVATGNYHEVIKRMTDWAYLKRIGLQEFVIDASLIHEEIFISMELLHAILNGNQDIKKLQFIGNFRLAKKNPYVVLNYPLEDFLFQGIMSNDNLVRIAKYFHNLKSLNLSLATNYENDDIGENNDIIYEAVKQMSIQSIFISNKQLKKLCLHNVQLNSIILSQLGHNCPELEIFDVTYDNSTTSSFLVERPNIQKFSQECRQLKYFNIDCKINGDLNIFLDYFSQNNPLLEVVGLAANPESYTVIDLYFRFFTKNCPLLKELRFSGVKMTEFSCYELNMNCHNFETLKLYDCDIGNYDFSWIGFISELKSLTLSGDSIVTNAKLLRLTENNRCSLLENISIRDSNKLTNTGLKHISNIPLLKSIYLDHIADITDRGIINLVKNNSKLEHIKINYCPNINNECLLNMAQYCRLLRSFEINIISKSLYKKRAPDLSSGFEALVENCPLLTDLRSITKTPTTKYDSIPIKIKIELNNRKKLK